MTIQAYGDNALLINFDQKIDPEIHRIVKMYYTKIGELDDVKYQIPAYCSITVVFDQNNTTFNHLKSAIESLQIHSEEISSEGKTVEIPVCYEGDFAPDMKDLSQTLEMSPEEIISLHTSKIYDVYMMGFLPGFPYLGGLPTALECKRKSTPRKQVKSGSVGIAGNQTGIYPSDAPGGWQLIGQTPIKIFNPQKEEAFLVQMGDKIKFKAISAEDFKNIQQNGK